ncbi:hypothetical protein BD626DRAFT_550545 [Schizophyllum amplum]|uniref:Uncharacterized protein n=1 Tax=Schizophyllum amplum TaxID=97359 RepID=A0A550C201_9AGAR|nr:hypothetical protein BD626DRAFT_550545 [Auriculariopsis ampla]
MVYIPLFSTRQKTRDLERRKGGGKGGGSSGSSSSGSGRSSGVSVGGGSKKTASSYSRGGGSATTIPSGSLFAGRQQGGGSRDQVYGTRASIHRQYGSGYPGVTGRGVAGRNFPFFFWPLTFGAVGGVGAHHYLSEANDEYGLPDNSSRTGGIVTVGNFTSNSGNSTFRLIADNSTTVSLLADVTSNCSSSLDSSKTSTNASTFDYKHSWSPNPGEVVQYYRASSVALMLIGYNNSAVFNDDDDTPDDPIPSWADTTLLDCLNQTIGAAVPLIDNGCPQMPLPNIGLMGMVFVVWLMALA